MAKKSNLLLVDLNDKKTKAVAETITSDTSRKILDHLANVENASESEISKAIGIALSTTNYHMQKLQDVGLVEITGFTYSKKGREINRYELANKYIVITPKKITGLKSKLKKILPIAAIPLGLGFVVKFMDIMQNSTTMGTFAAESSADYAYDIESPSEGAAMDEVLIESAPVSDPSYAKEIIFDPTESVDLLVPEPGFDFGLNEIAIVLLILSFLIVAGYLLWAWFKDRKN